MPDDRLRKLVVMLSSDEPGEVAAAAEAIGRALKAEGRDWHWLAAELADSEAPPEGRRAAADAAAWAQESPRRREWGAPPEPEPEPEPEKPTPEPRSFADKCGIRA